MEWKNRKGQDGTDRTGQTGRDGQDGTGHQKNSLLKNVHKHFYL